MGATGQALARPWRAIRQRGQGVEACTVVQSEARQEVGLNGDGIPKPAIAYPAIDEESSVGGGR